MSKPIADLTAERGLVACVMVDPRLLDDVRDHVQPDDFTNPTCAAVYRAVCDLDTAKEVVDTTTISSRVPHIPFADLLDLTHTIPSLSAAMTHARRVEGLAKRRTMASVAIRIAGAAQDTSGDVDAFLSDSEAAVLGVTDARQVRKSVTMAQVAGDLLVNLDSAERYASRRPCGLEFVDRITRGGARPGRVVVIAARPGMGKTALGLHWALATAATGWPVLFHSLEMPSDELGERTAATLGGVDLGSIGAGSKGMDGNDVNALVKALSVAAGLPITIDDTPGATLAQIRSRARRVKRANGGRLGLIVIDYLQLMTLPKSGNRNERTDEQIGAVTRGLKTLAKELGCAVILLAQLNREVERRGNSRPRMSDLRGSGEIEQDADMILMLSPVYANGEPAEGVAEVIVEKQRGGATGVGEVSWQRQFTRFADLTQEPQWKI